MPDPLSIALLTHSVNPRGGVVHTLELAEALRQLGHHVTIVATARPGQRFFRPVRAHVELVPLPAAAHPDMVQEVGTRIAATQQHLAGLLARRSFDILHTQDPIGGNALANLSEQGLVRHFVRTVHHLDHFEQPQLAAWQTRGWRAADQVLCVSSLWQEHLRSEYGHAAGLVHNGVDTARYTPRPSGRDTELRQRLGMRPNGKIILSIGGIEERKNTVRLLEAFIALHAQHPETQLVIAGGASLLDHSAAAQAFQQILTRHGMTTGPGQPVLVTGPLADEDMPSLLRIADVTAMPSIREGFGLVVLESLVSGTPVVVSRIRPFTDYLAPQDASWADPLDPASIEQALKRAISQHQPARVLASARRLAAHYDWNSSARQHLSYYRKVLDTSPLAH